MLQHTILSYSWSRSSAQLLSRSAHPVPLTSKQVSGSVGGPWVRFHFTQPSPSWLDLLGNLGIAELIISSLSWQLGSGVWRPSEWACSPLRGYSILKVPGRLHSRMCCSSLVNQGHNCPCSYGRPRSPRAHACAWQHLSSKSENWNRVGESPSLSHVRFSSSRTVLNLRLVLRSWVFPHPRLLRSSPQSPRHLLGKPNLLRTFFLWACLSQWSFT